MAINISQVISISCWPTSVDDLSPQIRAQLSEIGIKAYRQLVKIQFDLCYHAHISIKDSDDMSHPELILFYHELKSQKDAEDSAMREAKSKHK